MSFDWSDYLALARALRGDADVTPSEEARLRSALSRAYYAVYGSARAVAISSGYTRQRFDTSHQALIRYFQESPDRARKAIGVNLERMQKNRERADYERDFRGNLAHEVSLMITLGASVLDMLQKLQKS
jgi:uncharacterized protein (UPF0332 family)